MERLRCRRRARRPRMMILGRRDGFRNYGTSVPMKTRIGLLLLVLVLLTGCVTAPKTVVLESCSATPEKPCPDVTCPATDTVNCRPAQQMKYIPPPCATKAEQGLGFILSILPGAQPAVFDLPSCHEWRRV